MGTVCKHCGAVLLVVKDGLWGHAPTGVGVCRNVRGEVLAPLRFAEPAVWEEAE